MFVPAGPRPKKNRPAKAHTTSCTREEWTRETPAVCRLFAVERQEIYDSNGGSIKSSIFELRFDRIKFKLLVRDLVRDVYGYNL